MDPSSILYEDNHLIALNKKSSEIVQGDRTGDTTMPDTIKAYLKKKYNKPGNVFCGVIHRLDRPTSGVILFARTSKGLERMRACVRACASSCARDYGGQAWMKAAQSIQGSKSHGSRSKSGQI